MLRTGSEPLLTDDARRYLHALLTTEGALEPLRSEPGLEAAPPGMPPPAEELPIPDAETDARAPVLEPEARETVGGLVRSMNTATSSRRRT